jgi:hypothetical protein
LPPVAVKLVLLVVATPAWKVPGPTYGLSDELRFRTVGEFVA